MYVYTLIYKQIRVVDESWCFISTFLRNEPSAAHTSAPPALPTVRPKLEKGHLSAPLDCWTLDILSWWFWMNIPRVDIRFQATFSWWKWWILRKQYQSWSWWLIIIWGFGGTQETGCMKTWQFWFNSVRCMAPNCVKHLKTIYIYHFTYTQITWKICLCTRQV